MSKALMIALSNPATPEAEDALNTWYEEQHLPDVLAVEGVQSATRYRLADTQLRGDAPHRYLALYELDADDLPGVVQRLKEAKGEGRMPGSDAVEVGPVQLWTLVSHRAAATT